MNSCDERWRDKRDLRQLLAIADEATTIAASEGATELRDAYEALIARRADEDAGKPVV